METGISADCSGNSPELVVLTVNKGPSTLYDFHVSSLFLGRIYETLIRPELAMNEENRVRFDLSPMAGKKGTYPVVIRMDYRDKEGIPVSECRVAAVSCSGPAPEDLVIVNGNRTLGLWEKLDYHFLNKGNDARDVSVHLYYPPSITASDDTRRLRMKPGTDERVSFQIMNRYANSGDSFSVFCVAEWDMGDTHHTTVGRMDMSINQEKGLPVVATGILWLMLVISIGFFLYFLRKDKGGET